ncbi:ERCC4 domain-containing protein [Alkalicoccobacillus plakortidis]|uniref:ERCC4 domain-containing protein n=1 Tax=Alkalicoccobacillus plakortidis TaxID=444060 RepID=A0ABT0XI72_9BACI|nr:ERCC4 domain-containing protein [Alkalicoccobacillus plakortidis]MCM2675593.1 ERCC4 domain-containing protein [Alkalicoccobacillus plakortidis]
MNALSYRFTETEMKKLLKTLVIVVDTREQRNEHILNYFRDKEIPFKLQGMKTGDYGAMIPKNEELGLSRDIYLAGCIERKNGIDEIVGNIKERHRFENELIRAAGKPFVLMIEELDGYKKILNGEYISEYKPQSLLGSLKTFEVRYNFTTYFISPSYSGNYIYHHFYYMAREMMKV